MLSQSSAISIDVRENHGTSTNIFGYLQMLNVKKQNWQTSENNGQCWHMSKNNVGEHHSGGEGSSFNVDQCCKIDIG